ncbi:unnamed protein product [Rotaria magnacalcarata]|uniref:Uncharacterized protein n=1 Tax=Rotaria magnacalcarata TaxID=392030 RepID=A0A815VGM7_9BILA|nr:unnamed protein product [Rotaria magnacalcarata]CAF1602183.1 unnamed protein product [Rotaria magnacalcarata]CAF1931614.1 unnamed protein product [Rotaria magnacalcarata]CAF2251898.1 unnamed protein product [Rotaria magnacalcarata]
MLLYGLTFSLNLLFVLINAQNDSNVNSLQQSRIYINVAEHEPNSNGISIDSHEESWQTTTERTLIRVTRLNRRTEESNINQRRRRQIMEVLQTVGIFMNIAKAIKNTESGEEILGMAKQVAIFVLVTILLCILCCCITIVFICVKCCCGGNNRKRNQAPTAIQVPQPIYIQAGPSGYQPQYYQQQAPQPWSSIVVQSPESRPMLPQPSAPPQPMGEFNDDHSPPPPYEKLYMKS